MKSIYNLKVKKMDTIEDATDKNDKLINMVKKLQKQVSELKTQNTTLQKVFNKTEIFLKEVTEGISLNEILQHVKDGSPLRKVSDLCPHCNSKTLKKMVFQGFHVILCNQCGYREKINEK
jgi:DNA-directed RNA polymerase subunit RPC12/RpoP